MVDAGAFEPRAGPVPGRCRAAGRERQTDVRFPPRGPGQTPRRAAGLRRDRAAAARRSHVPATSRLERRNGSGIEQIGKHDDQHPLGKLGVSSHKSASQRRGLVVAIRSERVQPLQDLVSERLGRTCKFWPPTPSIPTGLIRSRHARARPPATTTAVSYLLGWCQLMVIDADVSTKRYTGIRLGSSSP